MESLWHGPTYEVPKLISYSFFSFSFFLWWSLQFSSMAPICVFFLLSGGLTQSNGLENSKIQML